MYPPGYGMMGGGFGPMMGGMGMMGLPPLPQDPKQLEILIGWANYLEQKGQIPIPVSPIGAILAGEPWAMFLVNRAWTASYGIVVNRAGGFKNRPDHELLGHETIVMVERPDINYVAITDWIRAPAVALNGWAGIAGKQKFIDEPDWFGSVIWVSWQGNTTLEHLTHPRQEIDRLRFYSMMLLLGRQARQQLSGHVPPFGSSVVMNGATMPFSDFGQPGQQPLNSAREEAERQLAIERWKEKLRRRRGRRPQTPSE